MTTCAFCGNEIATNQPSGYDLAAGHHYHIGCESEHCTGTADYPDTSDDK